MIIKEQAENTLRSNDGGDGRVLWCSVRAVQEENHDFDVAFTPGYSCDDPRRG